MRNSPGEEAAGIVLPNEKLGAFDTVCEVLLSVAEAEVEGKAANGLAGFAGAAGAAEAGVLLPTENENDG